MTVFGWINRQARAWWPVVATTTAFAVIGTMIFVVSVLVDQRDDLRAETAQTKRQAAILTELVEAQRLEDEGRAERLAEAITEIEGRIADLFALHDENVARKLNDTLHHIQVLLGRPVSTPAPSSPPHQMVPSPTTKAPAPTTTTTTTPNQKGCIERPDGPHC